MNTDSSGSLLLTPHQQVVITISLELDEAGHYAAARYLREKHLAGVKWTEMLITHVAWEEVFRRHNEAAALLKKDCPF